MKNNIFRAGILFIILLCSCEEDVYLSLGFDSPINKNSEGLVIADISHQVRSIILEGIVSLSEGEAEVHLINPIGDTTYSTKVVAPAELNIDEIIDARPGYWKLKYKSIEGIGEIELHLQKY